MKAENEPETCHSSGWKEGEHEENNFSENALQAYERASLPAYLPSARMKEKMLKEAGTQAHIHNRERPRKKRGKPKK